MKALYSSTNKRFPVWTISHAGHIVAPKDKNLTASDGMSLLTSAFLHWGGGGWEGVHVSQRLLRLRVTSVETYAFGLGPTIPHFGNLELLELFNSSVGNFL